MTGSISEGEDVVQEALFHAYRRLDTFDDTRPLKAWLFRIAHNRCIDFLRQRGVREETESQIEAAASVSVEPTDPVGPALGRAVEYLVTTLPPKERACVLLKDVLDYSLEEIAELVDSTVGGVKAALNREKLPGVRYGTFKLDDGVSFVHIASIDAADGTNPLTELSEFKAFSAGIKERCEEPPVSTRLNEVGSYELFGQYAARR
jgi:RNA polymerase sigma factor (sigma-70 family)